MKRFTVFFVLLLLAVFAVSAQTPTVLTSVAMTSSGWGAFTDDVAGQTGVRRQAEAIRLRVNSELPGSIRYRVYAGGAWSEWKYHNDIAGTIGANKFITSVQIELTGELDDRYDIQYTVFQGNAWTPWVANGADGGQTNSRAFVEGLQVILTENRAGRRPQGGRRAPPPPPPAPPGQSKGGGGGGGGRR